MGAGVSNLRASVPKTKNFNAANRAEKVFDKTQSGQLLRVPPKHKSYADALRQFQKENPTLFETFGTEGLKKHEVLDQNLRSVFVTSTGNNLDLDASKSIVRRGITDSAVTENTEEATNKSWSKTQDGKWNDLYRKETDVPKGKINVAQLLLLLQKHKLVALKDTLKFSVVGQLKVRGVFIAFTSEVSTLFLISFPLQLSTGNCA